MSTYLFESKRLGFRPFQKDDAKDMYHLNLDPEVIRYTGDPPFRSIEESKKFIAEYDH